MCNGILSGESNVVIWRAACAERELWRVRASRRAHFRPGKLINAIRHLRHLCMPLLRPASLRLEKRGDAASAQHNMRLSCCDDINTARNHEAALKPSRRVLLVIAAVNEPIGMA